MLGSCFSTELFYSDVAKICEALEKLAFDTGIITIAEDMTISVSHEYTENADRFFQIGVIGL